MTTQSLFLSEIMTRVYIDVTEIHLQLTNVSVLWRSTAVTKDKTKEFKEPVIYSPMLTQTDMNLPVINKLDDFQFNNNRTGFKDFKLAITPTYTTLHRE